LKAASASQKATTCAVSIANEASPKFCCAKTATTTSQAKPSWNFKTSSARTKITRLIALFATKRLQPSFKLDFWSEKRMTSTIRARFFPLPGIKQQNTLKFTPFQGNI